MIFTCGQGEDEGAKGSKEGCKINVESICEISSPTYVKEDPHRQSGAVDSKIGDDRGIDYKINGHVEEAAPKSGSAEEHQLQSVGTYMSVCDVSFSLLV